MTSLLPFDNRSLRVPCTNVPLISLLCSAWPKNSLHCYKQNLIHKCSSPTFGTECWDGTDFCTWGKYAETSGAQEKMITPTYSISCQGNLCIPKGKNGFLSVRKKMKTATAELLSLLLLLFWLLMFWWRWWHCPSFPFSFFYASLSLSCE